MTSLHYLVLPHTFQSEWKQLHHYITSCSSKRVETMTSLHYLVLPHTHLDGEDGTGGTLLFVMAGVENVVVTGVHAGADPLAGGRPRTTG